MKSGKLSLKAELAPSESPPKFNADFSLEALQLIEIGPLIAAYAPLDIEGGDFDLFIELAASDRELTGYAKPLIRDLQVFAWKQDIVEDLDNPFQALWESAVELFSNLFQNQSSDQLASTIPIEGRLDNPDVGMLTTLGGILENAFIRAYKSQFDDEISLEIEESLEDSPPK